eukprot:6882448-Pyramimonas_sp.AAC.1
MRRRRSSRNLGAWRLSACETVGQSTSNAAGCTRRSSGKDMQLAAARREPRSPRALRLTPGRAVTLVEWRGST